MAKSNYVTKHPVYREPTRIQRLRFVGCVRVYCNPVIGEEQTCIGVPSGVVHSAVAEGFRF